MVLPHARWTSEGSRTSDTVVATAVTKVGRCHPRKEGRAWSRAQKIRPRVRAGDRLRLLRTSLWTFGRATRTPAAPTASRPTAR